MTSQVPAPPNIVVILADDLGCGDVQSLNPPRGRIPTPNLDRLARQGMVFTDAHSSSSVCSPSRRAGDRQMKCAPSFSNECTGVSPR